MVTNLGINLLRDRHALSEKEYLRENQIYKYAFAVLILVFVMAVGSVAYQLVLVNKLKKIENGIATSTQELAGYTEASAQQIYLKSRLKLIGTFLANRSVSRNVIEQIFSIDIPGVVISGMSFESDKLLSVQFTTDDALILENLTKYLGDNNGFFTQVVNTGVSRNASGEYQMQTLLSIPRNL